MHYRVLLADDHQIFRQGLRGLLEKAGHVVVGEASDGREALKLVRDLLPQPDIVVLDVSMPLLGGLDTAQALRRLAPQIKVIVLTMYTDKGYVLQALKAGVRGYVLKTQAAEDLMQAIDETMSGEVYLSPGVASSVVDAYLDDKSDFSSDPLTSRERQILVMIAEGKTSKEIARLLNISFKTAESHRTHVMKKLDIHETAGLVRYAIRRGLIQP